MKMVAEMLKRSQFLAMQNSGNRVAEFFQGSETSFFLMELTHG
jgi:hypothetical protein